VGGHGPVSGPHGSVGRRENRRSCCEATGESPLRWPSDPRRRVAPLPPRRRAGDNRPSARRDSLSRQGCASTDLLYAMVLDPLHSPTMSCRRTRRADCASRLADGDCPRPLLRVGGQLEQTLRRGFGSATAWRLAVASQHDRRFSRRPDAAVRPAHWTGAAHRLHQLVVQRAAKEADLVLSSDRRN